MFTAQCLLDLARDRLPGRRIKDFSFRAGAPLFEGQPIRLLGRHSPELRRADLWAISPGGSIATRALRQPRVKKGRRRAGAAVPAGA